MRRTLLLALLLLSAGSSVQACFEHPDRSGYQSEAAMLASQRAYYASDSVAGAGEALMTGTAGEESAAVVVAQVGGFAFVAMATLWLVHRAGRRAYAQSRAPEPVLMAAELTALVFDGPDTRSDWAHAVPSRPIAIAHVGELEVERALAGSAV